MFVQWVGLPEGFDENGMQGVLESFFEEMGTWSVLLDGRDKPMDIPVAHVKPAPTAVAAPTKTNAAARRRGRAGRSAGATTPTATSWGSRTLPKRRL